MIRSQTDAAWANAQVATLPARWCMSIMGEWERRRSSYRPEKLTGENDARRKANEALRDTVARLVSFALHEDLPLDADDEQVVNFAHESAEHCRIALMEVVDLQENGRNAIRAAGLSEAQALALESTEQREKLSAICEKRGVVPAPSKYEDVYAVRRMTAPRWWTLQARRAQARAVESAAIELGLVNRSKDCYVSNESLESRARQNDRNRAALEATIAKNLETQQEFTLAELAAKGPANKAIRRAELMTRINGFERVAIDMSHAGAFFTMTCPSEMHRFRTVGARRVVDNGGYDGTMPFEAQAHLSGVWARIRAKLDRCGVKLYGFRIAEPNHDGTPHWHCLMFADPVWPSKRWHAPLLVPQRAAMPRIAAIVRRYALEIPGDDLTTKKVIVRRLRAQGMTNKAATVRAGVELHEAAVAKRARENAQKGAKQHRVDWKPMDPEKGTAAAYIAKYVAKNIDGYRLEKDMYGNDSVEASARVEAWASRWNIRQFQQVGGPPVTVWRELRRVEDVPADAPKYVRTAFDAVNKTAVFEGRDNASVAWNRYVEAQGGVFVGRRYRIRVATVQSDALTAYGEVAADKPVGIEYFEAEAKVRDRGNNWIGVAPRVYTIESKRFTWEILRSARSAGSAAASITRAASTAGYAAGYAPCEGVKGLDLGLKRAPRAPWTCVNNCTGAGDGSGKSAGDGRNVGVHERQGGSKSAARDVREALTGRKSDSGGADQGGYAAR